MKVEGYYAFADVRNIEFANGRQDQGTIGVFGGAGEQIATLPAGPRCAHVPCWQTSALSHKSRRCASSLPLPLPCVSLSPMPRPSNVFAPSAVEVFNLGKAIFTDCKFTKNTAGRAGAVACYAGGGLARAALAAGGALLHRTACMMAWADRLPSPGLPFAKAFLLATHTGAQESHASDASCSNTPCSPVPAGASANFTNCDFISNNAQTVGGAILVGGAVSYAYKCRFVDNSAGQCPGCRQPCCPAHGLTPRPDGGAALPAATLGSSGALRVACCLGHALDRVPTAPLQPALRSKVALLSA